MKYFHYILYFKNGELLPTKYHAIVKAQTFEEGWIRLAGRYPYAIGLFADHDAE